MTDDEHRGQAGEIDVTRPAILLGQPGKWYAHGLTVRRPRGRSCAQTSLVLRIGVRRVPAPLRIVPFLEESPPENRHEARESRMHARTVQALVVILPEDFPVALDSLREHMTDHEIIERPCIHSIQGQIELPLERRRIAGQTHEHEAAPLEHSDAIERIVGDIETLSMCLRGGAQQLALQVVHPGVIGANNGAGAQRPGALATQLRAPVTASIVEGLQAARVVPHHQDFLIADLKGLKGALRRELARATDVDPVAVPDALQLSLVPQRIEISLRRQTFGELGETGVARRAIRGARHPSSCRRGAAEPLHYTHAPTIRREPSAAH